MSRKPIDVLKQAYEAPIILKSPHLSRCETAIDELASQICRAMYVDTLPEARKLLASMSNDAHVIGLRGVRSELEFLLTRKKQLEEK